MKLERIVQKPTYSGIIILLATDRENSDFKGLQQKHFRYALLKKPELDVYTMGKMETYFKDKSYLLNWKGVINTKYHLDKCLKNLLSWGFVTTIGKKGKKRYFLTRKYFFESAKLCLIRTIEKSQNITELKKTELNHTTFRISEDKKGKETILLVKIPDNLLVIDVPKIIEKIRRKAIGQP